MKIHEKDANSIPTLSSSTRKRQRPTTNRKPSVEDEAEQAEEPPVKKVHFHPFFSTSTSFFCLSIIYQRSSKNILITFGIYCAHTYQVICK